MDNNTDEILNFIRDNRISVQQISKESKIKASRIYSWLSNEAKPKADGYVKLNLWYISKKQPKQETFNKLQRDLISKFIEYKINLTQSKITGKPMPEQTLSNIVNDDGPEPTIESLQYQVEVLINQVAIARLEIQQQKILIASLENTISDKDRIIKLQAAGVGK